MQLQRQQSVAYKEILKFLSGPTTDPLLLVGCAGTGKTTVIGAVLSSPVVKRAKKVAVCAPTNKAVQVLVDKFRPTDAMSYQLDDDEGAEEIVIQRAGSKNIVFQTIHRTLKIRLDIDDKGREVQTAPKADLSNYDIVLIDEASMLDDKLLKLVMSLRGKAKVIFCGDDNQLPPVELAPGQEISSVFDMGLRTIRLTDHIRQSKDSDIVSIGGLHRCTE